MWPLAYLPWLALATFTALTVLAQTMHLPADADHRDVAVTRVWGHAHNDEMHGEDALTLALAMGMGSIEVDVWLDAPDAASPPTLLAGHEQRDLSARTLRDVYLDPLLRLLDANNAGANGTSWVGVYKDDPDAPVQLVIDVKNDPDGSFDELGALLEPLLARGYLTTYNVSARTWTRGPLTVIGTGATPAARVFRADPRVIFKDAPLVRLAEPVTVPATADAPAATFEWDDTIAPMASSKFAPLWNIALALPAENPILAQVRRYTAEAARRGIKSRWWGAPAQTAWLRRHGWALQRAGGADWVNGDDLAELGRWLREEGGGGGRADGR